MLCVQKNGALLTTRCLAACGFGALRLPDVVSVVLGTGIFQRSFKPRLTDIVDLITERGLVVPARWGAFRRQTRCLPHCPDCFFRRN